MLTTRRLAVLQGDSRQVFPLARIQAVGLKVSRHLWGTVIFAALSVFGFGTALMVGSIKAASPELAIMDPAHSASGSALALVSLALGASCAVGAYFAARPFSTLEVVLDSGPVSFRIAAHDNQARELVRAIEKAL